MKYNTHLAAYAMKYGEIRLPRKIKKYIFGSKISGCKLRRLLKSVRIISSAKTCYENPVIEPYEFCPFCGNRGYIGTGNMVAYPEHWENFYCCRCHKIVAVIDNSPFCHALQFPDDNYSVQ